MVTVMHTQRSLLENLDALGVRPGDGLFVHASMRAVGPTVGGVRTVLESLFEAVGEAGLIGMPGFSADACFPPGVERSALTEKQVADIERAVPGFDLLRSPTSGMGVIAEAF